MTKINPESIYLSWVFSTTTVNCGRIYSHLQCRVGAELPVIFKQWVSVSKDDLYERERVIYCDNLVHEYAYACATTATYYLMFVTEKGALTGELVERLHAG